jgi:regulator of protease activity HflC (stomatin/prohibitin superfamily)
MFAMLYKWGRFERMVEPGLHVLPPWYKVKYVVTKQVVVFDTPVKDCPTKDNVMVSIDILLVFRITDAKSFVDKLGPEKLDEYLRASQEEAVRGLVRSVSYKEVYTLSGRSTDDMVRSINAKLEEFGVKILSVTITDVRLPVEMAKALENATTMQMLQREHMMRQKYEMLVINNRSALERKEEELKYDRIAADKESEKIRAEVNKELDRIESARQVQVSQIKADQDAKVAEIKAQGDLVAARCQAEKETYVQELRSKTDAEIAALEEEKNSYVEKTTSKARLSEATFRAQAAEFDAQVEAESTTKVRSKREFELQKKRLAILQAIAENEGTFITGDSGVLSAGTIVQGQASAELRTKALQMSMDVLYGTQRK